MIEGEYSHLNYLRKYCFFVQFIFEIDSIVSTYVICKTANLYAV